MNNYILSLLFVYLSGRLFFYEINDIITQEKISWNKIIIRLVYGLILLLFAKDIGAFVPAYFVYIVMVFIDSQTQFRNIGSGYIYFLHLLLNIFLFPWILNIVTDTVQFLANPINVYRLSGQIAINKILIVCSGFFFTLKEGTIIIRLVLNRIKAVPQKSENPLQRDEQEYERGKLIGILERTFIYFLILLNQIGAIAVIIALKSLARFNELDNKGFAEYFLIGSLLSLLVAAVPAIAVIFLLSLL